MADDSGNNCGTILDGLSPKCGAVLGAAIAAVLSEGLDATQVAALGGFLVIVGDAMGYIAAQMSLNEEAAERCRQQMGETENSGVIHTK